MGDDDWGVMMSARVERESNSLRAWALYVGASVVRECVSGV